MSIFYNYPTLTVFQNLLLGLSVGRNFNYKTARYDSTPIAWRNIERFTKRTGAS